MERNQPTAPAVSSATMSCTSSNRPSFAPANAATPRNVMGCQAAGRSASVVSGAGESPAFTPAGDSRASSEGSLEAFGPDAPPAAGPSAPLSLLRDGAGELGLGSALGIAAGHWGVACVGRPGA